MSIPLDLDIAGIGGAVGDLALAPCFPPGARVVACPWGQAEGRQDGRDIADSTRTFDRRLRETARNEIIELPPARSASHPPDRGAVVART